MFGCDFFMLERVLIWKMYRSKTAMQQFSKRHTQNDSTSFGQSSSFSQIPVPPHTSHQNSSSTSSTQFHSVRSQPTIYKPKFHQPSSSFQSTPFEANLHEPTSSSQPTSFEPISNSSLTTNSDHDEDLPDEN